ncbi:MAG: DUF4125 family protein [Clostridiales bacterium]|nr:DUF4125 family protein [Clostridiales bacterium]
MSIIRTNTPKDAVVNDIVNREWEMFQKTQNIGGRAACQDQYDTFYANRYSQHSILQPDTLESYRNDLIAAGMIGRNLITEKYGYMMEFTDPDYYNANLRDRLPTLTETKAQLIAQIVSLQLVGYRQYATEYPALAKAGRPAEESNLDTSIRDYSVGEYKTYSEGTLELVLRDVKRMENSVMEIQKTLVSFYGFNTLEEAEEAQKQ